ncbi:MAG TPA: O-antigen ligase family protein [Xanthomarina sp.]|nr:O-antigen ligase family protein [Xanthomarina sp.]
MLKLLKPNVIYSNKTINNLIVLYALVLPLGHAIANIILGVMLFFLITYSVKTRKLFSGNLIFNIFWIFIFSILFFLYAISLFYSTDLENGFIQVYKKSPILILSFFIFTFRYSISKSTILHSIKVFAYAVTFVCLTSIVLAVYNCYDYEYNILLHCTSDQNLAEAFISYHKLYLSLYITIAIFFILHSLVFITKKFRFFSLVTLQILVLFFTLVLLGSRNSLLLSTLFIIGYPLVYLLKNKLFVKLTILISAVLTIIISSIYFNPPLQEKIKEAINYENQYNINKRWGGVSVRKLIWEYGYIAFKKKPIIGTGVGDTQKELNTSYLKCTQTTALNAQTYNAHNDILQIAVTVGLIGLSLYLFSLFYIFYTSFLKGNYIHCIFILLFLVSGLTESLLERDMGIRVYSFFTILLFIYSTQTYENTSNTQ